MPTLSTIRMTIVILTLQRFARPIVPLHVLMAGKDKDKAARRTKIKIQMPMQMSMQMWNQNQNRFFDSTFRIWNPREQH
jgi:hypothetical protein